jgi:1-acyl-sn-glycerol-3-phosphate acyltransferase
MFHSCCINNIKNCPLCNQKITQILNEDEIFSNQKYLNYQNDIESVKIINSGKINYLVLPLRITKFFVYLNTLILSKTPNNLINGIDFLFKFLCIKINIIDNTPGNVFSVKANRFKWNKNIINKPKIIITNHSSYLDIFIMYYLFQCGFVAGEFITSTEIGKLLASVCKLLIFKRGVDTNVVEKIKEYLHEQKQIVIFPEGLMKENNDTLIKFRTGSFYTGADICPVVIKYRNYVYDEDFYTGILKLLSQDSIIVDVYIENIESPPFNDERIEKIRKKMAKSGNFKLARTSNKI